jgi:hypothetical protein
MTACLSKPMNSGYDNLSPSELNRNLVHAGLFLVAFELVRGLVVNRVRGSIKRLLSAKVCLSRAMNMMSWRAIKTPLRSAFCTSEITLI